MHLWKLRRPVHVSWLIAGASLSFVVGVWAASLMQGSFFSGWWVFAFALGLLLLGLWRQWLGLVPLIILGGVGLGLWRGSGLEQDLRAYRVLTDRIVELRGVVREDPVANQGGLLNLELSRVVVGERALPGVVRVSVGRSIDLKRGDEVTVVGKLGKGFGTFPASMYRANVVAVARSPTADPGRVVRDWFAEAVRTAIPEPQASLGLGYLLGQKSALPVDLAEALQIAGLTHIVVASGYNLTILVRLARRLFIRFSKYLATLSSAIMIAGFVMITGLSPSMSRAGLVAGLSLATWYYGRRLHPFVLLPLAAAITIAVEPSYAWGDLD